MTNVSLYGADRHGFLTRSLANNQHKIKYHVNFQDYIDDVWADLKISCLCLEKKMLVPENELVEQIKIIDTLSQNSDFVFVETIELHAWSCLLLRDDYHPPKNNVYWLVPGIVPGHDDEVITWHFWLDHMQKLYQPLAGLLDKIDITATKPLWFDALLGRLSKPRQFIIDKIKKNNIGANVIQNIRKPRLTESDPDCPLIWEPGCEVLEGSTKPWYLYTNVNFYGQHMIFGQTLPLSIHEKTAYSVLSETGHSNSVIMLTEKSAKMMLAKRIFISFGSKGHLAYLRSIGFRTFDSVFDESYDQIDYDMDRWHAAWDTLIWLCQQDQQSIMNRAQEILQHNYKHMFLVDWHQSVIESIKRKLKI